MSPLKIGKSEKIEYFYLKTELFELLKYTLSHVI